MKVTLVGGNGFIGTHVVQRLQAAGHALTVLDPHPPRFPFERGPVEEIRGDYSDPETCARAVRGAEAVIHLASTSIPRTSNARPSQDAEQNLLPSLRLLEACAGAGVRRVVFLSSGGAVYGPPRTPTLDESHATEPTSAYGVVKLAIEKYLQLFHSLHGLEYVILRPTNPYGERQDPWGRLGLINVALGRCRTGEPLHLMGDGSTRKDFFYVGDLAGAVEKALRGEAQGIFNVGSGRTVSLNHVLRLVAEITEVELEVQRTDPSPTDVPDTPLCIEKARRHLGWEPTVSLEAGIRRTWEWVRSLPQG